MNDTQNKTERQSSACGVNLNNVIGKYGTEKQSKGLADLLKLGKEMESSRPSQNHASNRNKNLNQNPDQMVLNEILRTVRELESTKNTPKETRLNKKVLGFGLSAIFVIGLGAGALMSGSSQPAKVVAEPVKEVKAPVAKPVGKKLMVTNKFVNLRALNSPKGEKLTTIAPAQTVEILGRKGGWMQVSYHNKLTGEVFEGYVWEEFLAKLK